MAKRGTTKRRSVEQESYIAKIYGGVRSASSGAADTDAGDVRCETVLIECKVTGGPGETEKPLPVFIRHLEKVAEEAYQEGRSPAVALRYYAPDSILSNPHGWVDVMVRPVVDDAELEVS